MSNQDRVEYAYKHSTTNNDGWLTLSPFVCGTSPLREVQRKSSQRETTSVPLASSLLPVRRIKLNIRVMFLIITSTHFFISFPIYEFFSFYPENGMHFSHNQWMNEGNGMATWMCMQCRAEKIHLLCYSLCSAPQPAIGIRSPNGAGWWFSHFPPPAMYRVWKR